MMDHKIHFGPLPISLFLISMAAGASWERGLDGHIRFKALHVLQATSAIPNGSLSITDLSPKFLTFYEEAVKEKASPNARWELWKKMYHFAAVPPTSEGDKMARDLLDRAWNRYPLSPRTNSFRGYLGQAGGEPHCTCWC